MKWRWNENQEGLFFCQSICVKWCHCEDMTTGVLWSHLKWSGCEGRTQSHTHIICNVCCMLNRAEHTPHLAAKAHGKSNSWLFCQNHKTICHYFTNDKLPLPLLLRPYISMCTKKVVSKPLWHIWELVWKCILSLDICCISTSSQHWWAAAFIFVADSFYFDLVHQAADLIAFCSSSH